jgi:hypothetical protein
MARSLKRTISRSACFKTATFLRPSETVPAGPFHHRAPRFYLLLYFGHLPQGVMTNKSEADTFVIELRNLVEQHVRSRSNWYSTHTTWPRIAFRSAGVSVVVGSLLLPVVTAAKEWRPRDEVLTAVSLAVAILSSLTTFYRWDFTWQSRTKTATELQGLLAKWELALKFAETTQSPREAALSATQKLFDDAFNAIGSETNQFFTTIKWPEISKT